MTFSYTSKFHLFYSHTRQHHKHLIRLLVLLPWMRFGIGDVQSEAILHVLYIAANGKFNENEEEEEGAVSANMQLNEMPLIVQLPSKVMVR